MTLLDRIHALGAAAATWWLDRLEMAWPGYRPGTLTGRTSMRLVARTDDRTVSIVLYDPGGREIFAERAAWQDYDRAFFDRCLARAHALAGHCQLAVSVGIAHAIGRLVMIPRRARPQIDEILRAHIRKKTPLRLDEIFLRHAVRVMDDGRLEVRYLVAPSTLIDRVLQRLSLPPAQVATVENVPEDDAPEVVVPLAPSRRATPDRAGYLALGLLGVILVTAIGGFAGTVMRQALAAHRIEQDITALKASAPPPTGDLHAVYEMREALERFTELRSVPGILQVWDDLARVLPASSYLTELTISGETLQMTGYSASATALIPMIEQSLTIHGAVLAAPVIWAHEQRKERFSITAALRKPRIAARERD